MTTPTKPAGPPKPAAPRPAPKPAAPAPSTDVVEMDAMDVREWEQDQRTPQASDANLAALVRESTRAQEPVAPDRPRKASLVARAGGTGPVSPRPPRAGDPPPTSGVPAIRPIGPIGPIGPTSRAEKATPAAPRPTTRTPAATPAAPRPTARTPAARPVVPSATAAGTSATPARPGPGLRSPPAAEPDAAPSSSRPLSSLRVGVARAGSALDEARPSGLADRAATSGGQPALDDAGHRAPPGPVSVATRAAPILLPLPPPVEPSPSPDPLAVADRHAPPRPEPRELRATTEPRELLAAALSRRRVLWIGGTAGGAALVALIVALVFMGGSKPDAVATSAPVEGPAPGSAASARIVAAAPVEPTRTPAAPDTPVVRAAPGPEQTPKPRVAAIRPGPPPVKKLGGKKLVIEYSGRESEVAVRGPAARTAEDPAIARARSAYLSGNQKLFAGDAEGAVRAYHQALGFYPGYVGGYRGLGLAYAQLGNVPKALDAFRTYVRTVPGARDVALIKKRIARLSAK